MLSSVERTATINVGSNPVSLLTKQAHGPEPRRTEGTDLGGGQAGISSAYLPAQLVLFRYLPGSDR